MSRSWVFNRLSTKLTLAFLLASFSGVALVAVLAYRSTSGDFGAFLQHTQAMDQMMGGSGMMGGMMGGQTLSQAGQDFLGNLGRTLWIAGLSGAALAIFLGAILARQISAPVSKVAAAARKVARGDLSQRVEVSGSGELAEMSSSFNSMAAALSRAQELRRNMVADIAHELRTPLSVLRGNIEAMIDGVIPTDSKNLTSLHQETMALTRLIDDLRTLSLAEAGHLKLQPQDSDLRTLCAQVIGEFQAPLGSRGISIGLAAPEHLPTVRIDPDRTTQVLRNLLTNSMHYTPEGGRIDLMLAQDSLGVTVSVKDTGAGIPEDDLLHIFDRFYRVDRSRSRSTGGSGLGLAIVKQLVEAQGGKVWAESKAGDGATVSFTFPAQVTA